MSCRLVALLGFISATAHADPLADAVKRSASAIGVKQDKLVGGNALRTAIAGAQFVMLGEDHGIAQIPELAGALCTELAPHGFHRVALEVGPSIGPALEAIVRAPDPVAAAVAFNREFPESVAFYNWREELGFLQTCAKSGPLTIWGVDQELMGAPVFVLPKILETKPGPKAKAAIEALLREAATDRATAAKTGDYGKLMMLAASAPTIANVQAALAKDGSPEAQRLFATLVDSRAIYLGQSSPTPYLSNRRRARLMKETFLDNLQAAAATDHALPKVLLKLGGWHMYRGLNPLRSSELGNLVAEAAEGHKVEAVNLLVVGAKGEQLRPSGVGKIDQPVALDLGHDPDMAFLAPFLAAQLANTWTLFDLRGLRVAKLGKLDPELERLIFGYDFLVVIADPKPAHPLP